MTEGIEFVCEHVGSARYQVNFFRADPKTEEYVYCPCCGLRGIQDRGDPLEDGPRCPYCDEQPVLEPVPRLAQPVGHTYRDEWDYLDDVHPARPFEPGDYLDDRRR